MPPIDCEDQELLEAFLAETKELLEKLDDDLVRLEKTSDDPELLNRIFRSIHTVKGASSFLGFDQLVKVTHKAEDVLNRLRKSELRITPEIIDVILETADLVKTLVNDIKTGEIQERDIENTIVKLLPLLIEDTDADPPGQSASQTPSPTTSPKKTMISPLSGESEPPQSSTSDNGTEIISHSETTNGAALEKTTGLTKTDLGKTRELSDNTTVRVDTKRLDDLMNQVGELVLERNRMIQINQSLLQDISGKIDFKEEFEKLTKRMDFVTSELQTQVLKIRMLPVEKVFKKFPRIVRNMARDSEKEIDLQIFGGETELDRSVVDEIGDPLIHLIRNSVDHGLELPEKRIAEGKPRVGTLILSAIHEGNQIVISIKDDGAGIDTDKVGRKALEKDLVTKEQLASMSQRELLELIFLPGLSTKDKASDLSGRGVGMDVVKTNIKKLNGLVEIKSEKGQGSEFILRLPLTLAIIQSLLVEVEGEIYSVPLSSVLETLRVDQRQFHMIGNQEVLKLRDIVLPLIRLENLFKVKRQDEQSYFCYVVVVGNAEKRIGLVVTRLVGQQEIAIKSLGSYLANVQGISGSTILGDGRVALIIDPAALLENTGYGADGR